MLNGIVVAAGMEANEMLPPLLSLSPALPARQIHGFELHIKFSSANDNADMRYLLKRSPSHQGPPLAR
ncbi:hypothetical protein ARMSODRAFT_966116 [Armillaria solidipes]|uniref:Uncharacterized protein n=1 Tax=Armillaria solidipes TaxID=1076256 RepID=A0A2H3AS25_9AGAR|nr:hypothetical protein ARMSODRAFT_966116 [Armillaria solidipes]